MRDGNMRVLPPLDHHIDAITPQCAISGRASFASNSNCFIVPLGYISETCNLSNRLARFCGCVGFLKNIRRLRCQIASKQLWPWACFSLYQLARNKKKPFSLANQWLLSNLRLNTKISSGRALRPAPNTAPSNAMDLCGPLNNRGFMC